MGRKSQITAAAILTFAIAGCTIGETPEANNPPSPAQIPPTANKAPNPQSFNNPVVPEQSTPAAPSGASLIQPTNPKERISEVAKGRQDPFAQILGPQPIDSDPNPTTIKQVPKLPPLPTAVTVSTAKPKSQPNQPNKLVLKPKPKLNPVLPKVLPPVVTDPKIASILPPPPQPEAAKSVLVSGIVLIGKEPKAIIKVPDEPTSRYVQAGQRLVNGVLIKRIEMNEGSNPVVILEQYGMEVARAVGEPSAASSKSATETTAGSSLSMVTPNIPL
jgi:hypothetical protein